MKPTSAYTRRIINDDIDWLESRITRLEPTQCAAERRRADCYRQLLDQRQRRLADAGDPRPGSWRDYFG